MEIETFVLCDAATDYRGKLNILGTFDTIWAAGLPVVWPHCALALRVRFTRIEAGEHRVRINFMDGDGRAVLPPLDGAVQVTFAPGASTMAANLILNMERIRLERPGEHAITLAIDGRQERSLPLYLRLREEESAPEEKGGAS
ncbi:MAG: hypothetical protein V1789_04350 [PVC group bacterium]